MDQLALRGQKLQDSRRDHRRRIPKISQDLAFAPRPYEERMAAYHGRREELSHHRIAEMNKSDMWPRIRGGYDQHPKPLRNLIEPPVVRHEMAPRPPMFRQPEHGTPESMSARSCHADMDAARELTDPLRPLPAFRENGDVETLNSDLAVVRVVEWLGSSIGRRTAIKSLEDVRKHAWAESLGSESSIFAIWSTLDNGLFNGRLSPAVFLQWDSQELDPGTIGQTFAPGKCEFRDEFVPRIAIILGLPFLQTRARALAQDISQEFGSRESQPQALNVPVGDVVIAMLVHGMIHAWFMRACGQQKQVSSADHRLKHGLGFWKIMHEIIHIAKQLDSRHEARLHAPNTSLAEALINIHKPLREQRGWHLPRRMQAHMDEELFEHTLCHVDIIQQLSKDEVDTWYKKVMPAAKDAISANLYSLDSTASEPKSIPRHERGSPFSYIEVVWNRKAFDYKRKTIEKEFASLKETLSNGQRVFVLPRGVDLHTFRALDSFLKSGRDYLPELKPMPPAGPTILTTPLRKAAEADPLWIDIRAFKLGTAMGFVELANHALDRLRAGRTLRTDPLGALNEIYSSQSMLMPFPTTGGKTVTTNIAVESDAPDDTLRQWARRFMLATKPGNSIGGYYASNLCTIDKYCGSGGVQGLIASTQSAELEQDYQICLSQLWRQTPESMHPFRGTRSGGGMPSMDQLPGTGYDSRDGFHADPWTNRAWRERDRSAMDSPMPESWTRKPYWHEHRHQTSQAELSHLQNEYDRDLERVEERRLKREHRLGL